MDSNGFKIGSPLEEISRIKVGTPTVEHPVCVRAQCPQLFKNGAAKPYARLKLECDCVQTE